MRLPGILLAAAALAGCFTEVGNADDERLVEAKFSVEYAAAHPKRTSGAVVQTVAIQRFYLGVREAEFILFDSARNQRAEYHLWREDSAVLPVDFTGRDPAAALPEQKVSGIDPQMMVLECALPAVKPVAESTLDFARFADSGYIKGVIWDGKDSTGFLFALPSGGELNLAYAKSTLVGWYSGGRYRCQFIFYADKWISAAALSKAAETRDVAGRKVILLDAAHNAGAFAALTAAFPKSFNAQNGYQEAGP
jgi:hypothetical protein